MIHPEPDWELSSVLAHRRWQYAERPFPHFHVQNVFTPECYQAIEAEGRQLIDKGLSDYSDPDRLSRNMPGSDAFGWNLPPGVSGPFGIFYSQPWHDLLARLTSVRATGDVSGAVHVHLAGSQMGRIHRDLGVGWFSGKTWAGAVNPADRTLCSYIYGDVLQPGIEVHEAVRAVTMIFYLANSPWSQGDGGETGLYRYANDPIGSPAVGIPPRNNSLVLFENTPWAYHSFLANHRSSRTSVVLWLHRPIEEARLRFGERALFRWRRDEAGSRP
jgi:2OG-Fe(II) oxygenase superfamily